MAEDILDGVVNARSVPSSGWCIRHRSITRLTGVYKQGDTFHVVRPTEWEIVKKTQGTGFEEGRLLQVLLWHVLAR